MTLQLVVSPHSSLLSEYVLQRVKEEMAQDPLGKPIFYIVPEQMTFQQEYQLLQDETLKGSIRTQVVSFSRLAYRILQETGGITKQFIGSTGTQMVLKKIIEQRKEPFLMFQKAKDKLGFLQEIERLITEFKRHQITPEQLAEQLQFTQENVPLHQKLTDLYDIYAELTHYLKSKYIDGEDQLTLLIEKIKDSTLLENATIFIDGFHRFTPLELNIIRELLIHCNTVTITLTLDEANVTEPIDELDLFYQTKETFITLHKLAKDCRVPTLAPLVINDKKFAPAIAHLATHFDTRPTPAFTEKVEETIVLAEAVHPRAEIEGIIQEILHLVRDRGYRYRDIAIFVREPEQYYDLLQTLFRDYDIPVFVDMKRTMLNHPFIELIRSLLEIVETNWKYDALFRLLKTGYIQPQAEEYPLTSDAIDQLENYVLEHGIRSKERWLQAEDWKYHRFIGFTEAKQTDEELAIEKAINSYRKQVVAALINFDTAMRKATTVRERCLVLYEVVEHLNIPQQLELAKYTFEKAGELEKAREEEQVWQAVLDLLDELIELIGEEKLSLSLFRKMVEAGLESLQFAHVPPSLDHVIVGSIDHSRITNKKCVFLIGVNEGAWPLKPAGDGILNESERTFLEQFGVKLAASSRRVLLDDYFYMYSAFTLGTDFLWVSYVLADHEGNSKTPSQMIHRMREFFPYLTDPILLTDPEELQDAERFITTREQTRGPLAIQLARYIRGYPIADLWWDVLNWYITHETKTSTTYRILQSLFAKNVPQKLADETVAQLIPDHVHASVSRLEMFYRCSYQHFLQYHLQLQERKLYTLEAPDIGQLFHEALKLIPEFVAGDRRDFSELTKQDATHYAARAVQQLAPILQHHILASSNRYRYIMRKLQQVIAQATYVLSEQARASGFTPVGLEIDFRHKGQLKPLEIELTDKRKLILRGRIDRVDKAKIDNQLYLRIIDYKSSKHSLALEDVYYGLSLQMLTYLDVVLQQAEDWLKEKASPAGILYFHVHQPLLSKEEVIKDEELEKELFKEYKMRGLLVADATVARTMDTTLDTGYSNIIPVALRKDGGFYSKSQVADYETFSLLRKHTQQLIKKAGREIISGEVKLNPYENKLGSACRFCSFRSICQFDPLFVENNYRRLQPLEQEEVLKKIAEQVDEATEGGEH